LKEQWFREMIFAMVPDGAAFNIVDALRERNL
jgi:hypothetical protein